MNDDEDGKYHFIMYSDGQYIYAWDPVRRTEGRVIGTNFTNVQYMVTDSEDSDNNYLFIADQLEDGSYQISRFYVATNFSDSEDYTDEDYYPPSIILDYDTNKTIWSGPEINGLCINTDDLAVYWSSPTEQTIYKYKYADKEDKDDGDNSTTSTSNSTSNATVEEVADEDDEDEDDESAEYVVPFLQNKTQLSYILGMDCNQDTGLYWFNAVDADSVSNTSLYQMDYDSDGDDSDTNSSDGGSIELILSNLSSPYSLICDNDQKDTVYYYIDDDLYRVKAGTLDDEDETGLLAKGIGIYKNLFFYEDIIYAANDQEMYQISDYYTKKWQPNEVVDVPGITAAAFFISSNAMTVAFSSTLLYLSLYLAYWLDK